MAERDERMRFPDIEDVRLVRRGDYSTLYYGRQVRFNREVAVKAFTGRELDKEGVTRFEKECAAMGRLSSHPYVVTVFDSGMVKKTPYIVTEWLSRGSLHDQLSAGHVFDWRDAVDLGVKLAGALESGHRAGVLHQSIKPHNVFVSAFGEPLLGDFEIAPEQVASTRARDIRDTQMHAAPELFRGEEPSPASELYALASVVFTLVNGLPPFARSDEEPIVRISARKASEPPPDLRRRGVPAPVCAVLEAALAKDPGDRPSTAQELGRLLQGAQQAGAQPQTRLVVLPETELDRSLPAPTLPSGFTGVEGRPSVAEAAPAAPDRRVTVPSRRRAPLIEEVRGVLAAAARAYVGQPVLARLEEIRGRLDEPLRVAIAGRVKAGKSTLLNGLVGEELAPTDAGECTRVVIWYVDGVTYRATLYPRQGPSRPTTLSRDRGAIDVELGGLDPGDIDRVVVEWPSSSLATMTLIDTPGISSVSEEVSRRAEDFLVAGEAQDSPADAVIYLMRHVHSADVRFLEAFHEADVAYASPINAIGVLSRADELGVGRPDALESAARIADRYRRDPKVRRLCQTVVPVAGLLAQAGATLREDEYRALERLAKLPAVITDELLVSADRFMVGRTPAGLSPEQHKHLLGRFGMYGVRLALTLIRSGGVSTSNQLANEMVDRSGLRELRDVLMSQFAARRDVLKARAALTALAATVKANPVPQSEHLASELERIEAGAHEFAEIRLLTAHRSGVVQFRPNEVDEVDRLLGTAGFSPAARLGLPLDADEAQISQALQETLVRWQRRAENPLSSRAVADAARVLVRTCEGMLESLAVPV
ncbi:MAG TPA: serine/threonine-protein kinase [Acidimicrobiales bacterium]|nr:serine/threonine-protein kinase [Acidimicrobiales bacterium]